MEKNESLETGVARIKRILTRTDNSFSLFFVLVNLPKTRKQITRLLIAGSQRPVVERTVHREDVQDITLDGWLRDQLQTAPVDSIVFLYNLQDILPTDKNGMLCAMQQLNWRRSALAAIERPLIIFLPRYALDNMAEFAPDFYDWYSNVYEFTSPGKEIEQITSSFIAEFSGTELHPAEWMNKKEKQDWLHTLTALLDEHPKQNQYRAQLFDNLGRLQYAIGNLDDAFELYQQSLEIRKKIGDKSGEGTTLNNISQVYDARGEYNTALLSLKKALEIRQEIGDKMGEGATLNDISLIYDARGDYDTALAYLKKSLNIRQEIGDKSGEGETFNNISQIFKDRGDYDTAFTYLQKSLNLTRETGNNLGVGTTLNNISLIYEARGDYETALSYLKKSLNIAQKIGNKFGEGKILNNISLIYSARGDHDTALSYLKKSLEMQQKTGDVAGLCTTLFNIGHSHWQNDESQNALKTWVQSYLLAKKLNLAQILQALEGLAEQLRLIGKLEGWQELADKLADKK